MLLQHKSSVILDFYWSKKSKNKQYGSQYSAPNTLVPTEDVNLEKKMGRKYFFFEKRQLGSVVLSRCYSVNRAFVGD